MLGTCKDVANSVKSIPEHKILANIANIDKNHNSNCSELLMTVVLADSPAVANDKPQVLKKIELKSFRFEFRIDRMIFRKKEKISIARAHTLINGIFSIDEINVDCVWTLLGTTITYFSISCGYRSNSWLYCPYSDSRSANSEWFCFIKNLQR